MNLYIRPLSYLILFLLCMPFLHSQNGTCPQQGRNLQMDNTCSNVSKQYKARDKITFSNGYRFGTTNGVMKAKLEETLIVPLITTKPSDLPNIDNMQINTHLAFGAIPGVPGVSETGAGTYSIPISVPDGVAGITANLGIIYNSQSGNGLLGLNWHLAGLSAITRVSQNFFYDNKVAGINLNNEDRFALDGNRLLPKNGSYTLYGSNNFEYEKEITDFSSIKSFSNGNNPNYFVVTTKDGFIIEYGNSANSRLHNSANNVIVVWYINKISDRNGNYITFTYDNGDFECVISHIEYTGNINNNQAPTNKITFVYETRQVDANRLYMGNNGGYVNSSKVLKRIIVRSNNYVQRKYEFNYFSDNIFTKLYEVKLYGHDNEEINSTLVKHGDTNNVFNIGSTNNVPFSEFKNYIYGDFTGNGKTDIASIDYETVGLGATGFTVNASSIDLYRNISDDIVPNFLTPISHALMSNRYIVPPHIGLAHYLNFIVSDILGNNKDDILLVDKTNVYSDEYKINKFDVLTFQNGSFSSKSFEFPNNYDYRTAYDRRFLILGDFNGNGNTDFITILKNYSNNEITEGLLFSPSINNTSKIRFASVGNVQLALNRLSNPQNDIKILDFNGDGKQEIMIIYDTNTCIINNRCCHVIEIEHVGNDILLNTIYDGYLPNLNNNLFNLGDFNGDGKTDLVSIKNGIQYLYYSTGNNFIEKIDSIPNKDGYSIFSIKTADFNSDGKTDIALFLKQNEIQSSETGNLIIDYKISSGYEKFYEYCVERPNSSYHFIDLLDINGDGNCDFFSRIDNVIIFNNFQNFNKYASIIIDGIGNSVSFKYASLNTGAHYEPFFGFQNTPPETHLKGLNIPLYVVSQLQIDNPIGTKNTLYYKYTCAYFNKEKRSLLGFIKKENISLSQNLNEEVLNLPYLSNSILLPVEQTTLSNGQVISTNIITNQFIYPNVQNTNVYMPYHYQVENTDLNGNISKTTNSMNLQGNINSSTTNLNNGKILLVSNYDYVSAGMQIPHKVREIETTTTYQGQTPFSQLVTFTYNNLNGNLLSEKNEISDITTFYELYNNFGQPQKIRTTFPDMPERFELFEYSADGRFVLKKTNDMDLSLSYKYHQFSNNLIEKTDAYGLKTKYKYDNFHRLTETTDPLGNMTKSEINWELNSGVDNAVYSVLTTSVGFPYSKTFFNKKGMEIKTETQGYGNKILTVDYEYDRLGNIIRKTEPYFDGITQNPHEIFYNYYPNGLHFNRPKDITARGLTTHFAYGQNSVSTTSPNGLTHTKTFDVAGNVISSSHPLSNIVAFIYGSHGQPVSINANGITTTSTYNNLGQQTQLNDINAGTVIYEQFSNGLMKTQTDARNIETTTSYDPFHRIDNIISQDRTIVHEYYTTGNNKGRVKNINDNNSFANYEYDNFGRITKLTETIENTEYSYKYQYNSKGLMIFETYPNNFTIKYEYDANGYLLGVKDAATNQFIWQTSDYNEKGQVQTINLKNNLSLQYDYHETTNMLKMIKMGNVFDMRYEYYQQTGNMLKRKDNIRNIDETFEYDDLQRLEHITFDSETNSIIYDELGNITKKYDIGNIDYDPVKVHAVSLVVPFDQTNLMWQNSQNIEYNANGKATKISEGDYELNIIYGYDNQRRKSVMTNDGQPIYTRYYMGKYEIEETPSGTKEICYIPGPAGNIAVYVTEGSTSEIYYTLTDHLGSIVAIVDEVGDIIEEQSFDAWGRLRNPNTWTYNNAQPISLLFRGYTGHEMLTNFGLINMNGRMYDPVLGRMLSPDNYVQDPFFPQNYNRYAYCWNNPLKYTDPSGDFIWAIAAFIVRGGYDLLTNNWQGWEGSGKPAVMAGFSGLFAGGNMPIDGKLAINLLKYSANIAGNQALGQYMPGVGVSLGDFSLSLTPGIGFGLEGLFVGGHISAAYDDGTYSFYGSVGSGTNIKYAYGYGGTINGWGAGRYFTSYGDRVGPDGKPNPQVVGGLNIYGRIAGKPASIRVENDFLSGTGDKWRSNAVEISWSKYSIGTNLYNNNPEGEGLGTEDTPDRRGNCNKHGFSAWLNGQTYYSPLWFGIRNGNTINRIGYSHPSVQDVTQNNVHRLFPPGYQNYYNKYDYFYYGFTNFSGYYNPFSLW